MWPRVMNAATAALDAEGNGNSALTVVGLHVWTATYGNGPAEFVCVREASATLPAPITRTIAASSASRTGRNVASFAGTSGVSMARGETRVDEKV